LPSSPDFSPIDNLWSKLKIILRSIDTTNHQELGKAIELEIFSRYQALPGNEKKKP
jgi:transposase